MSDSAHSEPRNHWIVKQKRGRSPRFFGFDTVAIAFLSAAGAIALHRFAHLEFDGGLPHPASDSASTRIAFVNAESISSCFAYSRPFRTKKDAVASFLYWFEIFL